jgi:hypothetical protein
MSTIRRSTRPRPPSARLIDEAAGLSVPSEMALHLPEVKLHNRQCFQWKRKRDIEEVNQSGNDQNSCPSKSHSNTSPSVPESEADVIKSSKPQASSQGSSENAHDDPPVPELSLEGPFVFCEVDPASIYVGMQCNSVSPFS